MTIREYSERDFPDVQRLLRELQATIVRLDPDGLNVMTDSFDRVYAGNMLRKVDKGSGKVYVAEIGGEIVGLIAGCIERFDEDDSATYRCPMEGRILELIVSERARNHSVGSGLVATLEGYFKSLGCENMRVNVFAHNPDAERFYQSHAYRARTVDLLKKL